MKNIIVDNRFQTAGFYVEAGCTGTILKEYEHYYNIEVDGHDVIVSKETFSDNMHIVPKLEAKVKLEIEVKDIKVSYLKESILNLDYAIDTLESISKSNDKTMNNIIERINRAKDIIASLSEGGL